MRSYAKNGHCEDNLGTARFPRIAHGAQLSGPAQDTKGQLGRRFSSEELQNVWISAVRRQCIRRRFCRSPSIDVCLEGG